MKVEEFVATLGSDFYTGVPDSRLKALCDFLIDRYGVDGKHHRLGANEGNCAAMAAGFHLATGGVPVVYMQNSGLGNMANPQLSLLHEAVYGIPCVYVIGWRGEPGTKDEPQHVAQGAQTEPLLRDLGITAQIIDDRMSPDELADVMADFRLLLDAGQQVAFLVKEGALTYSRQPSSRPQSPERNRMRRETILERLLAVTGEDIIVATTGKTSRELFELRERRDEDHDRDFLTVGSMGHASSLALGIAMWQPERRVWCVDGDGAALMHLGAMATIGAARDVRNLVHVVINNESYESVGAQPTVAGRVDLAKIAKACGYTLVLKARSAKELAAALESVAATGGRVFLEVAAAIGSRQNLGRPTTTPEENKLALMCTLGVEDVAP